MQSGLLEGLARKAGLLPFRGDNRLQAHALRGKRVVRKRSKHHAQSDEIQDVSKFTNAPFRPADGFDLRFDVKDEVGNRHESL